MQKAPVAPKAPIAPKAPVATVKVVTTTPAETPTKVKATTLPKAPVAPKAVVPVLKPKVSVVATKVETVVAPKEKKERIVVKEKIEAPVLSGPTIVGKINLDLPKKAIKESTKHVAFRDFPIEFYDAVLHIVKKSCAILGKDAVTVSKNHKGDESRGSVWFSCTNEEFFLFRQEYVVLMSGLLQNARRITMAEMIAMPFGQDFLIANISPDLSTAVMKYRKVSGTNKKNKVGISYVKLLSQTEPFFFEFGAIAIDGTFVVEDMTGYLYVLNENTVVQDLK